MGHSSSTPRSEPSIPALPAFPAFPEMKLIAELWPSLRTTNTIDARWNLRYMTEDQARQFAVFLQLPRYNYNPYTHQLAFEVSSSEYDRIRKLLESHPNLTVKWCDLRPRKN